MGKSFLKDFSWYFIGSFIPIIIGVLKTPIFTRHFNHTDFGYLSIVLVTFSFVGIILFSWISSCIWRYYPKYKEQKSLKVLYSNLFFLFSIALLILIIVSGIWYYYEINELTKKLVFLSFFNILVNQLYLSYIIVVRLEGKAKFYTMFQSIRAILNLVVALLFVFVFNEDISALVSSLLVIDILGVLILIVLNPSNISMSLGLVQKKYLKELIIYGSAGLLLNICFLIISSSDRYIIAWLGDLYQVGIYDQVYKLSQLSVMALVTVFFNTVNPTLIYELETNYGESKVLIRNYLKVMVLVGFPIVFYISFFSKDIANIFLGESFREGYPIMPFIFFAAYLHGISNFYELRLKFTNKLKKLSFIVIIATVLNIALTICFVWLYGYFWAAITTALTYILLIFLFHLLDKEIVNFSATSLKFLTFLIFIFSIQFVIYTSIELLLELTFLYKLVLILLFMLMYFYLLRDKIQKIKLLIR